MTINGTYTVKYLDPDGIPRAYASGPSDEYDTINDLAKAMIEAYISEPGHATRERDIEKFTRRANYTSD